MSHNPITASLSLFPGPGGKASVHKNCSEKFEHLDYEDDYGVLVFITLRIGIMVKSNCEIVIMFFKNNSASLSTVL